MENSYRMKPDHAFPLVKVREIIAEILEEELEDYKYNHESCGKLSRTLANKIRDRVKLLTHCERYKLICFVAIGDKDVATVALASRCVWSKTTDSRAEATYSNASLYAVGVIYALYHE